MAWDVTNRSRGRKPAGGSGGTGGDVIVRVAPHKDALDATRRFAIGEDGTNGGPSMRRGRDGPPCYVEVPRGTAVTVNGRTHHLHHPGEELVVARGTSGKRGQRRVPRPPRHLRDDRVRSTGQTSSWTSN